MQARAAICCLLSVSVGLLPTEAVRADLISTEAAAKASPRAEIVTFLKRPEVVSQLQALGVEARTAQQRVAAMSDEELTRLASRLPVLPAGGQMYPPGGGGGSGGGGYGSGGNFLAILLVVAFLVGLFWWLFRGTDQPNSVPSTGSNQ